MEYIIKTTSGELYHHGILGQKWGVRRYQNKDGSLTPAGKKHVSSIASRTDNRPKFMKRAEDYGINGNASRQSKEWRDKILIKPTSIADTSDHSPEFMKRAKDHGINAAANRQYQKQRDKMLEKTKSENNHEDYNKAHDKSKSVETMSDAELRSRLNRLQMEQQYTTLSDKDIKSGKDYLNKIIKAGTTVATVTSTALTIYNNLDKIIKILKK